MIRDHTMGKQPQGCKQSKTYTSLLNTQYGLMVEVTS